MSGAGDVPLVLVVDDARWFPLDVALQLASFERERDVLIKVSRMVEAGELVSP